MQWGKIQGLEMHYFKVKLLLSFILSIKGFRKLDTVKDVSANVKHVYLAHSS